MRENVGRYLERGDRGVYIVYNDSMDLGSGRICTPTVWQHAKLASPTYNWAASHHHIRPGPILINSSFYSSNPIRQTSKRQLCLQTASGITIRSTGLHRHRVPKPIRCMRRASIAFQYQDLSAGRHLTGCSPPCLLLTVRSAGTFLFPFSILLSAAGVAPHPSLRPQTSH